MKIAKVPVNTIQLNPKHTLQPLCSVLIRLNLACRCNQTKKSIWANLFCHRLPKMLKCQKGSPKMCKLFNKKSNSNSHISSLLKLREQKCKQSRSWAQQITKNPSESMQSKKDENFRLALHLSPSHPPEKCPTLKNPPTNQINLSSSPSLVQSKKCLNKCQSVS